MGTPTSVLLGFLFVLLVAMAALSTYFYSLAQVLKSHVTEIEYVLCTTIYECPTIERGRH